MPQKGQPSSNLQREWNGLHLKEAKLGVGGARDGLRAWLPRLRKDVQSAWH